MEKAELNFLLVSAYGRENFYPQGPISKAILELVGNKVFRRNHIQKLLDAGIEITFKEKE